MAGEVAQVVERQPSKHEALNSNTSTAVEKKGGGPTIEEGSVTR
jgi:hypothetical protein